MKHPDKTFIGKVSHVFDFLGVDFQPGEESKPSAVSRARLQEKLQRHFTHAARLYEQGRLKSLETIERYLSHWLRWSKGIGIALSTALDTIKRSLNERCQDSTDVMTDTFSQAFLARVKQWKNQLVWLCLLAPLSAEQFGLFTYRVVGDTVAIMDYPVSAVGAVEIPPEIEAKPVTHVGYMAFAHCTGITSVTIPDRVTSIGAGAFAYRFGLTAVTIPDDVTLMGDWAFSHCIDLTSATISNNLSSIGGEAFMNCTSLTSVAIPGSVVSIAEAAFANCTSLTSVTIPTSVVTIGENAFLNCEVLTAVTIPGNAPSLGPGHSMTHRPSLQFTT